MLPTLPDFLPSIEAVHRAGFLFAPIHNAIRAKQANYLHLAIQVEHDGITSGRLPQGGSLKLNWGLGAFEYQHPNGQIATIALQNETQASLCEAILTAMRADELGDFFAEPTGDSLREGLVHKLNATGRSQITLAEVSDTQPILFNAQTIADYGKVLDLVYTAVARFRGRLRGHMTPMVVWPEHFDLSTLWLLDSSLDENQAHINIGFAPYTPNQYDEPYLYAYAYPYPSDFVPFTLPEPTFWNPQGWRGTVLRYTDIARQADPEQFIEMICEQWFKQLSDLL